MTGRLLHIAILLLVSGLVGVGVADLLTGRPVRSWLFGAALGWVFASLIPERRR